MSRKIERLYEQATGWEPRMMEPKPSGPYMQEMINGRLKIELPQTAADGPDRYQILRGEDGDGVYTVIIDHESKRAAYIPGDHTRNPDVLTLPKNSDWITIGDGESTI